MKKDLLVIFGGASPEYEVSCGSGASLIAAIDRERYCVHAVGVSKSGEWFLTKASRDEIADAETWLKHPDNRKAILSPDRSDHGLLIFDGDQVRKQHIDVVFPIIHGATGEDGRLQGLLDIAGIPYVGSGVCASACSMDKTVTMVFADLCGIKRPEYYACDVDDYKADPEGVKNAILSFFRDRLDKVFPLFVKPASTGSSVGISKVESEEQLRPALDVASQFPGHLIIEQGIDGREIKVAVAGNTELVAGDICECIVNGIFNDYSLKYKSSGSHKQIPADIPAEKAEELKEYSKRIYKCLGCKGFARVDFFLQKDGVIVFNEINTVPGFTDHSIYSLMFASKGKPYPELVEDLIQMGLNKGEE